MEKTKSKKGFARRLLILLVIVAVVGGIYYAVSGRKEKGAFSDTTVVATVDGDKVYLSDVKQAAASIPQLAELPFEMIYPQLLENYLNIQKNKK